jgi:hypothetical protein
VHMTSSAVLPSVSDQTNYSCSTASGLLIVLWVIPRMDLYVDTNVSEKHAVSI